MYEEKQIYKVKDVDYNKYKFATKKAYCFYHKTGGNVGEKWAQQVNVGDNEVTKVQLGLKTKFNVKQITISKSYQNNFKVKKNYFFDKSCVNMEKVCITKKNLTQSLHGCMVIWCSISVLADDQFKDGFMTSPGEASVAKIL